MNLVDTSGWIEYFSGSEYAVNYEKAILDTENLIVPTIDTLVKSQNIEMVL